MFTALVQSLFPVVFGIAIFLYGLRIVRRLRAEFGFLSIYIEITGNRARRFGMVNLVLGLIMIVASVLMLVVVPSIPAGPLIALWIISGLAFIAINLLTFGLANRS